MSNVNWCLVAVSFGLGLLLTLAFLIRRVKREVPVRGAGSAGLMGSAGAKVPTVDAPDAEAATEAEEVEAPYGEGSARVAAGAAAPTGWTIKGNEDSMLYHSPESPAYKQTIAELWFRDEETAIAAGFARWDSGKSQRGQR
jgi:uncharacterized membrane protein ArfC